MGVPRAELPQLGRPAGAHGAAAPLPAARRRAGRHVGDDRAGGGEAAASGHPGVRLRHELRRAVGRRPRRRWPAAPRAPAPRSAPARAGCCPRSRPNARATSTSWRRAGFGWDEVVSRRRPGPAPQARSGRQDRHRRPPARQQGRRPDRRGPRPARGHVGGLARRGSPTGRRCCDARALVDRVRERSGGIPVGVKMSAQHVEADLDAALDLGVDYVILDGRGGGTGAAPTIFRDTISVPTMAALARARRHLDLAGARDVTLVATGGFRRAAGHGQGARARRRRDRGVQRGTAGHRLRRDARLPHRQLPDGHRHPEAAPARPAPRAARRRAAHPLPRRAHRADGRAGQGLRPRLAVPLHPARPHELEARRRRPGRRRATRGWPDDRMAHWTGRDPRRGTRPHRDRRRPLDRAHPLRRDGSARWTTTARTRAGRSARARSRTGCCAAPGTATTTTRPRACRRRASPTRPLAYPVEERADGTYVELPAVVDARRGPCPTCWSRRWSRGASTPCSAWSGTPTSGSPTRCAGPRQRGELRYVGIRHEGAAAFAASAYGKLTGRPAACFAIAGPGSTNLLTGLYDAKLDGAPVLAISGQVPSKVLGRGAFQDVDLSAVFRDVALSTVDRAHRLRPRRARRHRGQARRRRARGRPPGPARRGAGRPVRRAAAPARTGAAPTSPSRPHPPTVAAALGGCAPPADP